MEPIIDAATTAIIRSLIHALRNHALEVKTHRLKLDILQVRLSRQIEVFSTANYTEALQYGSQISQEQDRLLMEILAEVQHVLSDARQDATRITISTAESVSVGSNRLAFLDKCRARKARAISRMQWAIYRRARCERRSIAILALIDALEGLVSS
jgi:hypothetical protein